MDSPHNRKELAYWFALLRAPAIQTELLHRLLHEFKTPLSIFRTDSKILAELGVHKKTIDYINNPAWDKVKMDLEWNRAPDNHLITYFDENYPVLLKEIHDPPLALFLSGVPEILQSLQLSIVGSRRPSPDGRRNTREFAERLAQLGLTITSGLAAGLDSDAHKGALAVDGTTIAVLGSGLKQIYPKANNKLAQLIIEKKGAVISELPPDFSPLPMNFPRRNRIISGLSLGTLVVEAAENSGSLITARFAMEQGREVFAIPGSIHNPLTRGCHELIRQGAKLTEKIDDILEEIGPLAYLAGNSGQDQQGDAKKIKELDELSKLLLDNIGSRPVSIDSLVEVTALSVPVVSAQLLQMELSGVITSMPGGKYIRV